MSHSHSQEHREFQRILDAAIDQPLDAETQAVLDRHLAGCAECRHYAAGLKKLEARLGSALVERWPATLVSDGQRASALGKILSRTRRIPMHTHISGTVRSLALGTLAILLIVALGWGIRTLRPVSPAGGGMTPTIPVVQTQAAATSSAEQPVLTETPVPTLETVLITPPSTATLPPVMTTTPSPVPAGSVSALPKLTFTFATDFPAAPDQVMLYQQQLPQAITADQARQAALLLGVDGQVIQYTGEGGGPIYEVHGGGSVVRFLGSVGQFIYEVMPNSAYANPAALPPFDQQVSIAEAFLRQKGLLEGTYRTESVASDPGVVRFVQLLDDRPVRYGVGDPRMASPLQWIDVSVNADGQVSTVSYNAHQFQPAGQYPILDARQAWERFSANPTGGYGMYAILSAIRPATYRSWVRDYPAGAVHIYDYAVVTQSAGGEAPVIQFSRYPLSGDFQDMVNGKFLHAWGQIVLDDQGRKTFNVEGWEISTLADTHLRGTLRRQGDNSIFTSDAGQAYPVSDLPADLPDGAAIDVSGVILNGEFIWSFIQTGELPTYYNSTLTCGGGGGGGDQVPDDDFGGGLFANLALEGQLASPTQSIPNYPYHAGDTVDGQVGNVWININKYADHTEINASMWVEGSDGQTYVAILSGTGITGIENYNALPIKVWGRVDKVDAGNMYITVDRFEEAYPGLHIQAWLGTEKSVALEGKTVLLFTTQDGQQFVLSGSISNGDQVRIGHPGDTVIHVGELIPGNTFGGYQVLLDLAARVGNGLTDLTEFVNQISQPNINDQTLDVQVVNPSSVVQGKVTIDTIELVYVGYSLAGCSVNTNSSLLVMQPAWRYTGHFEDGRRFEALLQALPDTSLTFGMPGG